MNAPAGLYFGRWDGKHLTFDYVNLDGESTSGYTSLQNLQENDSPSSEYTQEWVIGRKFKIGCPKEYMFWMD